MFKKEERKRKSKFGILTIFRLFLSLAIFLILGLGALQAFRYFSGSSAGPDLLKLDPKATLIKILTSEDSAKTIFTILGLNLPGNKPVETKAEPSPNQDDPTPKSPAPQAKLVFKFALVGDSHNDNNNLKTALETAKQEGAKFAIGMGDYSDTGTLAELQKAKDVFDASGLPYYVTAGDHDLWDARDKGKISSANFNQVFGSPYQTFADGGVRFIIIFNADNYDGVDPLQMSWLEDTLKRVGDEKPKLTFAFMHEALSHPTSDRFMGKTNKDLIKQAEDITKLLKEAGVAEAFAGDIHAFTRYQDIKTGLSMTTVGALTTVRNTQAPRFAMVDVYDDGSYNIKDLEIK